MIKILPAVVGVRAVVALALAAAPCVAQYPYLLADVYPGTGTSDPWGLYDCNGRAIWTAFSPTDGRELWTSDGTPAGTHMLHDIRPGPSSSLSTSASLVEFNGWWYFPADDGIHGEELWRTDGTSAGTALFFEFEPGPAGSQPTMVTSGNLLFVYPATAALGREPWISDGTVAGTVLLADTWPGPSSGLASAMRLVLGQHWFIANDGTHTHGRELWTTDGTSAGTAMLADLRPGSGGAPPGLPLEITPSLALFLADDGIHGRELWRTDGTPAGTALVMDFIPGSASPYSMSFRGAANGGAVMAVRTPSYGDELWFSDGTAQGTILLADFYPGPADGIISYPTALPTGRVVGFANSPATGVELFVTDGTVAGTTLVDTFPGPESGATWSSLVVAGDRAYYFGRDSHQTSFEIAVSDGTPAGTFVCANLLAGPTVGVHGFISFGAGVLGGLTDSASSLTKIAYSDGTPQHTAFLQSAPGQALTGTVAFARVIGGYLYFRYRYPNAPFGDELFAMPIDVDADGTIDFFDDTNIAHDCFCSAGVAPCGNTNANAGCANSTGAGANLTATGTSRLANDDLVLTVTQLPSSSNALLFMGSGAMAPNPFYDGVRCVASPVARWPLANSGPGGTIAYGPGLAAASSAWPLATQLTPGSTWRFQLWYRDSTGPCGNGTNLSNSATIVFTP